MTLTPEEALESQLLSPPLTKTPLSFLEWASASSGIFALMAETLRRLFPSIQEGNGFLAINTVILVAIGLVCIQGIPILTQELISKRRGVADYYMLALLVFCLVGSAVEMKKDLQNHFLGILPILFAGYGITKRKFREYNVGLQNAAYALESGEGPKLEIFEESKQSHTVGIETVKAGDYVKIKTGNRIWMAGIIHKG